MGYNHDHSPGAIKKQPQKKRRESERVKKKQPIFLILIISLPGSLLFLLIIHPQDTDAATLMCKPGECGNGFVRGVSQARQGGRSRQKQAGRGEMGKGDTAERMSNEPCGTILSDGNCMMD